MHHDPFDLRLERSILRTVAYSDVFDFPPTPAEIHRYLEAISASEAAVAKALDRLTGPVLCTDNNLVALDGREPLFDIRRRRGRAAERLWPAARRWGRFIEQLPFVRMVAVTGALAVDNVDEGDDADYLIVTEPGRVWLCRALVTQVVRAARLRGVVLCPNWLLAADALELDDRSFFAARELAQMVPVAGFEVYNRMRRLNRWTDHHLPNATGPPDAADGDDSGPGPLSRTGERLLRGRIGTAVDRWDLQRKRREIRRANPDSTEIVLDTHQCKGHVDAHGERIRRAYAERLFRLGLGSPDDAVSGS
jgi:hypothetical protein